MANDGGSSFVGGSLPLQTNGRTFDVRVEADVIALLKTLHQSPLEAEEKNQLRDLVFAYVHNPQHEHAEKLRERLQQHGITLVRLSEEQTAANEQPQTPVRRTAAGMRTTRPLPRFAPAQNSSVSRAEESSPQEVKKISIRSVAAPKTVPQEKQKPSAPAETLPQHAAPDGAQKAAVKEKPAPEVVSTPQQLPQTDTLTRIREIKRAVNQKVGNPVNLIDSHNELGREYMNALLDAMKKSNGGSPTEVASAMDRLEKAFAQVNKIDVEKEKENAASAPVKDTPQQPAVAVQQPPVSDTDGPVARPIEKTPDYSKPVEPAPAVKKEDSPIKTAAREPQRTSVVQQEASSLKTSVQEKPIAPVAPRAPLSAEGKQTPPLRIENHERADEPQTPNPSVVKNQEANSPLHSVAKEKKLQDLMRKNRQVDAKERAQQEKERIAAMDPLHTPEVDDGLRELLSQWSLFKSSGFLGTGPSGKEHPLYVKLAPLTMAAVIAGRFEGASPAIKQNITDMLNGWRYEEGITHDHAETFEQYLRKVVQHILSKQKQRQRIA